MKPWIAVPATLALVYRAYSRNSLTPLGIVVAALTATAHAMHPWSVFFALLVVFFLAGTTVTKVKHEVKAKLTHSSSGAPGGEGPRTHIQVLANSLVASVLILCHAWAIRKDANAQFCWSQGARPTDVLVVGIAANYAAVAADTFSSELGILATSQPRLITAPWKKVVPGTNGGVTVTGIVAGLMGSLIIAATATALTPFCTMAEGREGSAKFRFGSGWSLVDQVTFMLSIAAVGLGGSLLDSFLGAVLQASVVDVRTGKVIEGEGGGRVLVHSAGSLHTKQRQKIADRLGISSGDVVEDPTGRNLRSRKGAQSEQKSIAKKEPQESRKIATGVDLLSNNGVNLSMAATMSATAVIAAGWKWDISLLDVVKDLLR